MDGAFGIWARATPERAPIAAGYEDADSWATDAHKWLNVPYDNGIALVRDGAGLKAMRISVSSWATTDDDVERSLSAMLRAAA